MKTTCTVRLVYAIVSMLVLTVLHGCAADSSASSKPENGRNSRAVTSLPDQLGQGAEDENTQPAHSLDRLYTRLAHLEAHPDEDAVIRVTQIGDSHTASDTFTGPARHALQKRFGDGGRGYLAAGRPWRGYRQLNASYDMSDGWSAETGLYGSGNDHALGGTRIETTAGGEWITRGPCARCSTGRTSTRLQVFYLEQEQGGTFDIHIDDNPALRVQSRSNTEALGVFEFPLDGDEHTLHIETVGDGTVTLFGTSMTDRQGVVVDSIGLNGAQLRHYLGFNAAHAQREIATLNPDLIILAFGANETMARRYSVRNPASESLDLLKKLQVYHREIIELLTRYQDAVPSADCLLLLPPDMLARSGSRCIDYAFEGEMLTGNRCVKQPAANFAGILNAQRYAAQSAGCAVWDQQYAMGGEGSMDIWRELNFGGSDGVHLRSEGYRLLADAFASDLIENYERWRKGAPTPLETHVIFPELATTAREHP